MQRSSIQLGPVRAHRASVMANGGRPRFAGSPCFTGWLWLAAVWFLLAAIGSTLLPWWPARFTLAAAFIAASAWTWRLQRNRWSELRAEFLAMSQAPDAGAAIGR